MPQDYEYDSERGILKINLWGKPYGPSIEDYDDCMASVIKIILEVKDVSSVVLMKEREYEYGPEQTRLLVQIAELVEDIVKSRLIFEMEKTKTAKERAQQKICQRFYPEWLSKLRSIVDLINRDPIGAYIETVREIRRATVSYKSVPLGLKACYKEYYIGRILNVIKGKFEATELIKKSMSISDLAGYHIGDRALYRQIFLASVRPNFMYTRYMIAPPENGISIERYTLGKTEQNPEGEAEVEIFKVPGEAQYFYHIIPPEFKLPEKHYAILDAARRRMLTERPKAVEFVKSEERKFTYNIGEDLIRSIAEAHKVKLDINDLQKLATILTRYTAGLGVLEVLLKDPRIQDIYINSPVDRLPILIFHDSAQECKTNLIPTREDAEGWATRLRSYSGRPLDEANPVLDTEMTMPDARARFAVITRTLSPEGLGFAIRRHRDKTWTLPLFVQESKAIKKVRMLDPLAAGLLSFLFDNAASTLIAGGRSSGKTSLLSAMMLEILPKVRVITLEDTLELPVKQLRELGYNIESMKSRSVITTVETEIPADIALRTALRLGESAMVVGEIRSLEAKVLWEAMRIGALSNVVAGTIHGENPYGVYDRVVNDLGVPATSFKATDIVVICRKQRLASGMGSERKVVSITEVRKRWTEDPVKEGGFVDLMTYSIKDDALKPTDTLINGESEVLARIMNSVKDFKGEWKRVWANINLRAKIIKTMVETSARLDKDPRNPSLLEADWIVKSNSQFHMLMQEAKEETGELDHEIVWEKWQDWYKKEVKSGNLP